MGLTRFTWSIKTGRAHSWPSQSTAYILQLEISPQSGIDGLSFNRENPPPGHWFLVQEALQPVSHIHNNGDQTNLLCFDCRCPLQEGSSALGSKPAWCPATHLTRKKLVREAIELPITGPSGCQYWHIGYQQRSQTDLK